MTAEPQRLQKLLAEAGHGSRRQLETLIREGRVSVNGRPAELGQRATRDDQIHIDGRAIRLAATAARPRVLAYYKPVGEVTTRADPEGRPTVFDRLPRLGQGRWLSVGRLDLNTQGLLLLTNDGELSQRLTHPSNAVEREYAVRVLGRPDDEALAALREGVRLDDGLARFDTLRDAGGDGANRWYHVTLLEGRNREVRRLWESQGLTVSRLVRVRFGLITLRRGLRPGRFDELDVGALTELRKSVGLSMPDVRPPPGGRGRRTPAPRSRRSSR